MSKDTPIYDSGMSESGPGCVKTRLSQGRAELFSQLSSRRRSCRCNRFSTSFYTAWVKSRPDGPEVRLPLYRRKRTQDGHRRRSG